MRTQLIALAVIISLTACDAGPEPDAIFDAAISNKVAAALQRAAQNESLNAFIYLDEEGAALSARQLDAQATAGPLQGMLLAVKDNIHVAGMPNSAGTPGLQNFIPKEDSPVIAALKARGAIILGKANMHELAFGITSDNTAFGAVRNPFDTDKFAGGSSGGTAAAVAAGIVDAGLGTDTGGSVRIPASLTGVTALRPSSGRYPAYGVTPVSGTRDTIGPIASNVADLIKLDSAIVNDDSVLPAIDLSRVRLGVDREYFYANLDPGTGKVMQTAEERLSNAGVVLVEVAVPQLRELIRESGFPIALYESVRDLDAYLQAFETGLDLEQLVAQLASPDVQGVFAAALAEESAISETSYQNALTARQQLQANYRRYFAEHQLDGMVFPTTILPARNIEGSMATVELNGQQVPTFPSYIQNTDPASIAGIPGISLPVGVTDAGLPVGLEIDAPENSDRTLLALALAIEGLFKAEVQ